MNPNLEIAASSGSTRKALLVILALATSLNLLGIQWGLHALPVQWHPDERVQFTLWLAQNRTVVLPTLVYPTFHIFLMGVALLPYYVWLVLSGTTIPTSLSNASLLFLSNAYLLARLLSVCLGTGTLYLIYKLGKRLYGELVGLLSAAGLAVTMGFVILAHLALLDVPMLFWLVAGLCASAGILQRGTWRHYAIAGIAFGLATATKYTGVFGVVALLSAHLLQLNEPVWSRTSLSKLTVALTTALAVFLLGTPGILVRFPQFIRDVTLNLAYFTSSGIPDAQVSPPISGWLGNAYNLWNVMGPALLLAAVVGLCWAIWQMIANRDRSAAFLLFWVLAYFVFISDSAYPTYPMRYVLPMVPSLLILTARLAAAGLRSSTTVRRVSAVLVAAVFLFSLAYGLRADWMLVNNSRDQAANWLINHVEPDTQILFLKEWDTSMPVFPASSNLRLVRPAGRGVKEQRFFLEQAEVGTPKYLVLSSYTVGGSCWSPDTRQAACQFWLEVLAGRTRYRPVARFPKWAPDSLVKSPLSYEDVTVPARPRFLAPQPEFINPTIWILEIDDRG